MTPQDYVRVKRIFAEAVALPEPQRIDFVHRRCPADDQVRGEVLSLLEHHQDDTILQGDTIQQAETMTADATLAPRSRVVVAPPEPSDSYVVMRDVWDENRTILRRRLIVIASIIAILTVNSIFRLPLTYGNAVVAYGVRIACLAVTVACALFLHYKPNATLRQIRIAEGVVMVNAGLLAAVIYTRMMLEAAQRGDATDVISVNNWNYFAWTFIIFVYGVFMPNNWRRAAAVLLPCAVVPSIVTQVAIWIDPYVDDLLDLDGFGQPLPAPFLAAGIGIYAAHLIHGARLSAFKARQLAQYKIKRLIGQGGMGQVYEAEHLLLKRDCAIKLILPEYYSKKGALRRFQREVQATARLTHPHTIEVYDYGQNKDGIFFFAMELLSGMNLRELVVRDGPLPPARAAHFLIDVCDALIEAHSAGLIHRDIKPANIFASQRGGIADFTKLLDFGVVREVHVDASLTGAANMIAGTPSYMSPEQIMTPKQIDGRSDLYSLAAVGFFLLCGRPPFTGQNPMAIMLAQVNQTPRPPSTYHADIPSDLESVIMQCLSKDPNHRPATAAQMREQLLQCECSGNWSREDAERCWPGREID